MKNNFLENPFHLKSKYLATLELNSCFKINYSTFVEMKNKSAHLLSIFTDN